jgi:hypothetical protein
MRGVTLLALMFAGCAATVRPFSQQEGSWFWSSPLPHGNTLRAVWVASPDESWAVGDAGTIVRFRAGAEEVVPSGTRADLFGVWGWEQGAWAVGAEGTTLRWDGRAWTKVPCPVADDLQAVWGSGPEDVFAVGATRDAAADELETGTILRWQQGSWKVVARNVDRPFAAVWGSSASDVYAGGRGPLWHFDGKVWSSFVLGDLQVHAIWGTGATDVWVAGRDTRIAHFDGQRWSLQHHENQTIETLAGSGRDAVWAWGHQSLFRYDGAGWQKASGAVEGEYFKAAGGRPGGPVALVGQNGGAAFWKDERWTTLRRADPQGTGHGFFWVDGEGQTRLLSSPQETRRETAGGWTRDDRLFAGVELGEYPRFWARGPGELWAWGHKGPARWMDGRWQSWDVGGEAVSVQALWGAEAGSGVWALAYAITGSPRPPAFLIVWDGQKWRREVTPHPTLIATAGTDLDDIWLLGDVILRWDGKSFRDHTPAGGAGLFSICANARDDAWAVGAKGSAFHWDGRSWTPRPTGGTADLMSVWCGGAGDVWAAGARGTVFVWNGSAWRATPTPTNNPLYQLQGTPSGLWASGWGGIILRWR